MKRVEQGTALVETVLVSLVLLIPILWMLGVLADVHRSALATTAAVREAGLDATKAASRSQAGAAIDAAVRDALLDHSVPPASARITWSAPGQLGRGTTVEVEVAVKVPVFQAPLLGRLGGPGIWVTARHTARVDPYGSVP